MRIKLSQSDWMEIGNKMGWVKTSQWDGRSDDYPEDDDQDTVDGVVNVEMMDMDVDEFPNILFDGSYDIKYKYTFPPRRNPDGDDSIEIKDIQVKEINCEWVGEGGQCPDEAGMIIAKAKIRELLLDPKHGWDHDDHIRKDVSDNTPYEDPDAERKNRLGY